MLVMLTHLIGYTQHAGTPLSLVLWHDTRGPPDTGVGGGHTPVPIAGCTLLLKCWLSHVMACVRWSRRVMACMWWHVCDDGRVMADV